MLNKVCNSTHILITVISLRSLSSLHSPPISSSHLRISFLYPLHSLHSFLSSSTTLIPSPFSSPLVHIDISFDRSLPLHPPPIHTDPQLVFVPPPSTHSTTSPSRLLPSLSLSVAHSSPSLPI